VGPSEVPGSTVRVYDLDREIGGKGPKYRSGEGPRKKKLPSQIIQSANRFPRGQFTSLDSHNLARTVSVLPPMSTNPALRNHVRALLTEGQAHCTFEDAVANLSPEYWGSQAEAVPYSVWELVEHIRRAQHDILTYCREADYAAPDWPDAYWPKTRAPSSRNAWTESVASVRADRASLCMIATDEAIDLYDTVPSSEQHTYLREVLLVADHTAYHVGQIVTVRRAVGTWPPDDET